MPLDPNIILRGIGSPTPVQSPMEAFTALMTLRAVREQAEERRLAGEERRTAAQEAAAKRAREQQVEATLQSALTFDPTSGQPTVDWGS